MIQFSLSIRPQPAPRPRVTRWGTYNTEKYNDYKTFIQLKVRAFKSLGDAPIKMSVTFGFKTPPRLKYNKSQIPIGDLDNLEKGILDAMQGLLFEDDRQVVEIHSRKMYFQKDFISVELSVV